MTFPDEMSVADAREHLRALADKGHSCPVCKQFVKVYSRQVNATMVRSLIAMWRAYGRRFGSLPDLRRSLGLHHSNQEATMQHWGLIEEESKRREDGGRAGHWRVTDVGEDWLLERATIPKYARIYDGRLLGYTGPLVSVRDALGKRFDYSELMST